MNNVEVLERSWRDDMKWMWEVDLQRFREKFDVSVKGAGGRDCKYSITMWVPMKLLGRIDNTTGKIRKENVSINFAGQNDLYRFCNKGIGDALPYNSAQSEQLKEDFLNYIPPTPKISRLKSIISFFKRLINGN